MLPSATHREFRRRLLGTAASDGTAARQRLRVGPREAVAVAHRALRRVRARDVRKYPPLNRGTYPLLVHVPNKKGKCRTKQNGK